MANKDKFVTLEFYESFRLELNKGSFEQTSCYASFDVPFPMNGKQKLKSLFMTPIPSLGFVRIIYPNGSVIISKEYNILKFSTKQIPNHTFDFVSKTDIDLQNFEKLLPKGTLTLKNEKDEKIFKLILNKLEKPNPLHYGIDELYIYYPTRIISN